MKQKKPSINYMDQIPVPNTALIWRLSKDGLIEIDIEHKGFYHRIAQKFFKKPKVSHIALDTYGTLVWQSMKDGHTIYDIILIMEENFPDEKDRMLDRVVTYMATLERNHFITMHAS